MKKLKCEICGNEYDEIMGECWNTINHTQKQDEVSSGVEYKSLLKFRSLFLNIIIFLQIFSCIVVCAFADIGGAIIIVIVFTLINIYVISQIQLMVGFLFDLNEKIDNLQTKNSLK